MIGPYNSSFAYNFLYTALTYWIRVGLEDMGRTRIFSETEVILYGPFLEVTKKGPYSSFAYNFLYTALTYWIRVGLENMGRTRIFQKLR